MKTKVYPLLLFVSILFYSQATAQTGYIYVHLKSINEETSTDFPFVLKNSSGTTINSFSLNDQATNNNTSTDLAANYFSTLDVGLSHGTGGDGQLWSIASTSIKNPNSGNAGTIYVRPAGSPQWTTTAVTTAIAIDGAYANQCVYVNSSGNVFFYNNGTSTQIYSGGDAKDVTANSGRIAIVAGGAIKLYSASYSLGTAPNTSGASWGSIVSVSTNTRLDMNFGATSIVYMSASSNTVKTVTLSGVSATLPSPGSAGSGVWYDVAYDDLGAIYAIAIAGETNVYSYNGSAWTNEVQSRQMADLTGGDGHLVLGEICTNSVSVSNIFSRQTDNAGNIYWIDDERVKSSSSLNGNAIIIPVTPGTYTLTETLPNSTTYDLGRYNIYDPGGSSTGNVNTQVITFVVTANEVVFGEYINENLNPKAIALTCTFQYLQTFDASTSSPVRTYTYGSGTTGTSLEGTAYHYRILAFGNATDGYYELEKASTIEPQWSNTTLVDHTGNGGYFLAINASYSKDEFYRQRVTNLVPGLSYTISFYAADLSNTATLHPSLTYGLQDSLGNIVNQSATGTITSTAWKQYSFTFTATTSRADLFISNLQIGGSGNDLAIDDISINPVLPVLTSSTGTNTQCVGSSYNFANAQSGGIWTTSSSAIVSVNPKTGSTTANGAGTAILTYTYTNQIGCTTSTTDTVTVSAPPVITATVKYATPCIGQADSLYTNFTTPSTAPYTYAWAASSPASAGLGTATIQNTVAIPAAAGGYTYTTTITDAKGCVASASVPITVSNKTAPTVSATATITSAACVNPTALNLAGSVSGSLTPNYSYVWSGPGTIVNPASGSISAATYNTTATSTITGNYTLTVTDGNGCIGTATTATAAPGQLSIATGVYAATKCNNTADSLYSVASGGTAPYTYQWTATTAPGTVTYNPGSTKDSTGVSFGTAGTYKFTVKATDANNCTITSPTVQIVYANVAGPALSGLNTAATKCVGSAINLTSTRSNGTSPFTFVWSGSPTGNGVVASNAATTTAVPTAAGSYIYTVKVTDANSCAASASTAAQTVNPALTVTVTGQNPAFCGTTGTDQLFAIASGGSGTYSTYAWTGVLTAGSGTTSLSSTSIANPLATISGSATGSAFKYTATVTDNNGCSGSGSTTDIVVASSPSISSVTATPSSACAGSSATVSLSGVFSGGTSAYNYIWTPPTNSTVTPASGSVTSSPITGSATATAAQNYAYGLTIIDANNCTATGSSPVFTLNLVGGPAISVAASNYLVCASPSGSINLTGTLTTTTTSPYSYAWTGNGVTNANSITTTATPTASGTYSVTVTDANGCTASGTTSTVIYDNTIPSVSPQCSGASLSLFESNGSSWLWTTTSGGRFYPDASYSVNNDSDVSHLQAPYIKVAGNYTVTIVDGKGCSSSATIPVNASSCTVLASSITGLSAQRTGNTVALQWQATNSAAIKEFIVERSTDGNNFIIAGKVTVTNNSSYHFDDDVSLLGCIKLYYHIQETGTDNSSYTSNTVPVNCNGNDASQFVLNIYPNPVISGTRLTVNYSLPASVTKAQIVVTNVLSGQQYGYVLSNAGIGVNDTTIPVSSIAAGTYFVRIISDKWISKTIKIIKQ